MTHNGAKLDQFEDKKIICDEKSNFESKDEKKWKLVKNDIFISDLDWKFRIQKFNEIYNM